MAGNPNEIILRVENVISGTTGGNTTGANGVPMQGVQPAARTTRIGSFANGISAQMFIEAGTRIISATGNAELSTAISKVSSYTFLGLRAIASGGQDIAADVALVAKISADVIQEIQKYREEQKQNAIAANSLDMLRFRGGAFSINANTQISYNKYGRVSFTNRK